VSKARSLGIGAAAFCIAASLLLWQTNKRAGQSIESETKRSERGSALSASGASPGVSRGFAATPSSGFAMDSSSLRGTEVDGEVSFDANGNVLLDPGLRRLFDYHLSLIGERDPAQIRRLLEDYLLGRHRRKQVDSVLGYFDRYVGYLQRLAESKIGESIDPQDRLAKATALRRQMLGDEMASAFFSEEEALAALTLERMAIAADRALTAEQKSQRLAALDRSEGYTARAEADTARVVADENRRLDRAHATAHQRAVEREAMWGKEAAGRLARLDEQRAQWDARIEQYLFARSRIDADRSLSPAARAQALAALRAQRFDAAEQRRIASLEAIGQLKPGG
jgi:lipase chaperone LimK